MTSAVTIRIFYIWSPISTAAVHSAVKVREQGTLKTEDSYLNGTQKLRRKNAGK